MSLRSLIAHWTEPEQAAFGRLEDAFGSLTIVDTSSDAPHLSAAAAYDLLGGDTNPQRVHLLAAQIRNRKQRRAFLRQIGVDRLNANHTSTNGHRPDQTDLFDRQAG